MWLLPHQRPATTPWWSCGPPEGSLSPSPWRCCASCQGSKPLSARRALLAALALRASLRLLLRCASFTRCARPSGQPAAVTALRFVYSLRSPFGPACGCYFASLRLLAALALRASLRLLLRFATFTRCARPSGQPAAVTALRFVYSLRSPFGPACGCYCAALRLLAALALRASLRLLLRCATFTRCARPSGQPAAVTALRYVYSLRSPF